MSSLPHLSFLSRKVVSKVALSALAIVTVYVLLTQQHSLRQGAMALKTANWLLIVLALGLYLVATGLAATMYGFLAFHKLHYRRTLLVETANLFVNRIIPGGIGGLGLNYVYLRHNHHKASEAATVVAVNNSLGLIGHLCLLAVVLTVGGSSVNTEGHGLARRSLVTLAVAVTLLIFVSAIPRLRQRLQRIGGLFWRQLQSYRQRPADLGLALAASLGLTLCTAGSFWLCCQAVGLTISFSTVFILFSISVIFTSVTPTPGGLGGAEASLLAGLARAKVLAGPALAAVASYRLISFWLPLAVGLLASIVLQQRQYLGDYSLWPFKREYSPPGRPPGPPPPAT